MPGASVSSYDLPDEALFMNEAILYSFLAEEKKTQVMLPVQELEKQFREGIREKDEGRRSVRRKRIIMREKKEPVVQIEKYRRFSERQEEREFRVLRMT